MALFSTRLPTIQARISALVVACILPTALAATLLLYRDFLMERANIERGTVDTARALSQAIDRELTGAEATLRVLSTSAYLKNGDLQSFHRQTQEILQGVQDTAFVLSDVHGQQLINTRMPFDSKLPMHGNARRFNAILNAGRPIISDLFVGADSARPLVAVELAVRRDRRAAYVLSMEFLTEQFGEILERQHLPKDQVISILDSVGAIIACAPQANRLVGNKIDPALLARINTSTEGMIEANTPLGVPAAGATAARVPAMIAFNRSGVSNWTLAISTPRETIVGALWESVWLIVAGTVLLLVLGLTLAQLIGGQISKSIKGLVQPALALGHGKAVIVPVLQLREANDVGQALVNAAKLIQQRTVERDTATQAAQHMREVKQKFEFQAYHDPLTGLANRMLFNELIKSGIESCAGGGESLSIFYIDVDDFKRINDRYGHAVGDELLQLFANRLMNGLRESDVTARLGGDEFAAILMRTNLSRAQSTAEALIDTLSRPYLIGDLTVTTSASIGVAGYPDSGLTPASLLRQADIAMYRAKTSGKHRCVMFDKSFETGSET